MDLDGLTVSRILLVLVLMFGVGPVAITIMTLLKLKSLRTYDESDGDLGSGLLITLSILQILGLLVCFMAAIKLSSRRLYSYGIFTTGLIFGFTFGSSYGIHIQGDYTYYYVGLAYFSGLFITTLLVLMMANKKGLFEPNQDSRTQNNNYYYQ